MYPEYRPRTIGIKMSEGRVKKVTNLPPGWNWTEGVDYTNDPKTLQVILAGGEVYEVKNIPEEWDYRVERWHG
jgi:hypothetical protein